MSLKIKIMKMGSNLLFKNTKIEIQNLMEMTDMMMENKFESKEKDQLTLVSELKILFQNIKS